MLTDKHFLHIANTIATASHCKRKKVGAVLVNKEKRIIGTGYNGSPAGTDNTCECENGNTKDTVIHAELNCILNSTTNDLAGSTLYITLSPCLKCAALLVQKKISRVVYDEEYRDKTGITYLQKHGIATK